jgi:hypothetical protein
VPPSPLDPWLAWWRLCGAMSWGGLAALAHAADPRPFRAVWSSEMSRAIDRAYRSPEFLELTAANLRAMASVARFASQIGFR